MVKTLNGVLEYALKIGAVDLILAEGFSPAVRIAGNVQLIPKAEPLEFGELENFLGPLDGECGLFCGGPWAGAEWRVRYSREAFGKMAVLRPIGAECPEISSLGVPNAVKTLLGAGAGLILFAGPAVSGKTTTASAFVSELCTQNILRVSLLDALPEYKIRTGSSLVQKKRDKVSRDNEILQGIRSGTDLFWLGDMNGESILPVLKAAASGALVVSTFTAGSVRDVLAYLVAEENSGNKKLVRTLLAANLRAIVTQRLSYSDEGEPNPPTWEVLANDSSVAPLISQGEIGKISELLRGSEGVASRGDLR